MIPLRLVKLCAFLLLLSGGQTVFGVDPSKATGEALGLDAEQALKTYSKPQDLEIQLVAAEPQLANPVAFTIDNRGRFFVAETYRHSAVGPQHRLYEGVLDIRSHLDWLDDDLACRSVDDRVALLRDKLSGDISKMVLLSEQVKLLEDKDGDGRIDSSTVFADGFDQIEEGIGAGVLVLGDKVYYACVPNLWALEDLDGDGSAEKKEVISSGYGVHIAFLGHDLHGLTKGPDGRLYFTIGDRGLHVESKEGVMLAYPDEGVVLRCLPDGSHLEVFARGLRNPQELAFDAYGNLFTGDNNSDGGDRARWVHLVQGGDSGWRIGFQHLHAPPRRGAWNAERMWHPRWQGQPAFILPPIANLGYGPSGLTHYPGTGLPGRYKDHFFLTDFRGGASSGIHAFTVSPNGASFFIDKYSRFVWDCLPTDVEFGVDGGLYFTDWVFGWDKTGQGRIYRVHNSQISNGDQVATVQALLAKGMKGKTPAELLTLFGNPDSRVRLDAQYELASRGPAKARLVRDFAVASVNRLVRLHCVWALGQMAWQDRSVLDLVIPFLDDGDPIVTRQALRILGEFGWKNSYSKVADHLTSEDPQIRFYAALNLGRLGGPEAEPLLKRFAKSFGRTDPYLRHAAVEGLQAIGTEAIVNDWISNDSPAVREAGVLTARRMQLPSVSKGLEDEDAAIVLASARAINDLPVVDALPALAELIENSEVWMRLPGEPVTSGPVVDPTGSQVVTEVRTETGYWSPQESLGFRVINANYRLGEPENAMALARLAADDGFLETLRVDALQALGSWAGPLGRDRVTGLWRPGPSRDIHAAREALSSRLIGLLRSEEETVVSAAISASASLKVRNAAAMLDGLIQNGFKSEDLRVTALGALKEVDPETFNGAVNWIQSYGTSRLKTEAIRLSAAANPEKALNELADLLVNGTLRDQQLAFAVLSTVPGREADGLLKEWMEKLISGQVPDGLRLDISSAAGGRTSPELLELSKAYAAGRPKTQLGNYLDARYGGDPVNGKKIFEERLELSCLRCHAVGGLGGNAGPDLAGIGARVDRDYLIESILFPNNQMADGFQNIVLSASGFGEVAGILKSETDSTLSIDSPEEGLLEIPKANVLERIDGLSAMPEEFRQILSQQDLRDLVAYLAELK